MSKRAPKKKDESGADDRVNIDFIKGTLFRTISPDGLMGSVTPLGKIQIALFSERQAIPQRVVYKLEDGELGESIETIGRNAIVREIDAVVTLDLLVAESLLGFLEDRLKEVRKLLQDHNNEAKASDREE
jgi:hypothetical protein